MWARVLLLGVLLFLLADIDAGGDAGGQKSWNPWNNNIHLHVKGQQVEQQTPEPPTDEPSGPKQQGKLEHPGVCPRRVEVQPLIPCNSTCSEDHECPLTKKCCYAGCSRGCLPSVRSDKCQLPPPEDSCKQTLLRYHYDPDKKKCVSYQSCGDNRNNFKTKELCEKACGKISNEVCKLPADPGRCQGYLEQYYFNWKTKKCEIFVYGLCGGNDNRFSTKLECQMVCGEFEQQQQQQPRE